MANSMKKSEILATIKANALSQLNLDALNAVQIDVGVWAIPTGEIDGITTYAKVAVTAANPIGTDKVPAFDLDAAVDAFNTENEVKATKAAERKAKHDARVQADAERRAKRAAEKAAKEAEKASKENEG